MSTPERTSPSSPASQNQNEGEGSRTAARHYAQGVASTVESGNVDALADKAKSALQGPEGEALRSAEATAKKGPPTS